MIIDFTGAKIKEGLPLMLKFHGKMDTPTATAGPQWFEALKVIFDYLDDRQKANEVKVMNYLDFTKLFVPEVF
jgi:hypothetical protein